MEEDRLAYSGHWVINFLARKHLGKLDTLQKGNLEGVGSGCPYLLQDKLGKMTGTAKLGAFAGSQEKKKVSLPLLEEGISNSGSVHGSCYIM